MLQTYGLISGGFISFHGECGIQVGDYVVNCHTINGKNQLVGGGSVAGFMKLSDAKACAEWINNQDRRHEAIIWPNPQDEIDYIRIT
ncbi:MAG: hypothetical protein P1P90_01980 [Patescibacteria group bacterium]|nr:hypothetical protein [Patescibacteria group bacterium]